MRVLFAIIAAATALAIGIGFALAQDRRELVRLPEMMQEHMLGNMRRAPQHVT